MFPIEVKKKITIVVASIATVALLALAAWFWYNAVTPPAFVNTGGEVGVDGSAKEVGEEEVDTSEWQTYADENYGFSFKYPSKIEGGWVSIGFGANNHEKDSSSYDSYGVYNLHLRPSTWQDNFFTVVVFYDVFEDVVAHEVAGDFLTVDVLQKNIVLNGTRGVELTLIGKNGNESTQIILDKNGHSFIFGPISKDQKYGATPKGTVASYQLWRNILSTFQFNE
jgi:hypothetical protein